MKQKQLSSPTEERIHKSNIAYNMEMMFDNFTQKNAWISVFLINIAVILTIQGVT